MKAILIFFIIILCSNYVYSNESGWIEQGNFKYEKLTFNNLHRVSISEDNNYFYSFHSDGIIRKWDLISGELLDSIVFDRISDLGYFSFSQDRKTVILTYWLDHFYYQEINIFDLNSKEKISKDTIAIYSFFCPLKDLSVYNSNLLFDYSSQSNQLYLGTYDDLRGTYGAGSLVYNHSGYLGIFNVLRDTLIPYKEITCNGIKYLTFYDGDVYFSYDKDSEVQYPHNPTQYYTNYGLGKYSQKDYKLYNLIGYETNHLLNSSLKISDLYIYPNSDLLLYKSNEKFQYFNLDSNKIIPGKSILSKSNAHCSFPERNLLVTAENDILFLYQLDKTLFSYITLPIVPDRLVQVENYILAYNYYLGQIILLNLDNITSLEDKNPISDMEIYPNPVQDILYIRNIEGSGKTYKIYNIYGQEVIQGEIYDGTINISNIENGLYYLRYSNINKKFAVVK